MRPGKPGLFCIGDQLRESRLPPTALLVHVCRLARVLPAQQKAHLSEEVGLLLGWEIMH